MMARNVEWLMNEVYPKEKIVLWAHNGHVAAHNATFRPMGSWLRESLGTQMYVLGFAVNSGSVRASTIEGGRRIGLAESKVPPAEPGTGTAILSAVGQPVFFLDLRGRSGRLGAWLAESHLFRSCGSMWDRDNPAGLMESQRLSKAYDGLIYLESTHAARGFER
jgi:erythromycin esterase